MHIIGVIVAMAPFERQQVVEDQTGAKNPARDDIPFEVCHQEAQGVYKAAPFAEQALALAH